MHMTSLPALVMITSDRRPENEDSFRASAKSNSGCLYRDCLVHVVSHNQIAQLQV